ncbi:MAG: mandelate racemase/muconate lactonizing enzyme family protein [Patescibacteria group bacterium]
MLGKIVKKDVWMLAIDLPAPFPLAFGTLLKLPRVFLILSYQGDRNICRSIGEASIDFPFAHYDAWDIYSELVKMPLKGLNILQRDTILGSSTFRASLADFPASFAALNMALDDAFGKITKTSVQQIYGCVRSEGIALESMSVASSDPDIVDKVQKTIEKGRVLKLKGGLGIEEDISRISRVLEILPLDSTFAIDFNASYEIEEIVEILAKLLVKKVMSKILFLEQPTKQSIGVEGLIEVKKTLDANGMKIPIMADESFVSLEDALACSLAGILLNFKLQKVGGITRAKEIESLLGADPHASMVGGTFPTAIGRVWDQQGCCVLKTATLPSDAWEPSTDWFTGKKHLIKESFESNKNMQVAKSGNGSGVTPDWTKIERFRVENPHAEYLKIRNDLSGERIKIELRGNTTYSEVYKSLTGLPSDWNI